MSSTFWFAAVAILTASPVAAQGIRDGGERSAMAAEAGLDVDQAVRSVRAQNGDAVARSAEQEARRSAYQENLRVRREQAQQYAAAARNGVPLPPEAAATLRQELQADIEQWRAEYRVGHEEWQAMRERWLVAADTLSALQWAQRRVDWWSARDAWVASHDR